MARLRAKKKKKGKEIQKKLKYQSPKIHAAQDEVKRQKMFFKYIQCIYLSIYTRSMCVYIDRYTCIIFLFSLPHPNPRLIGRRNYQLKAKKLIKGRKKKF